MKNKPTNFNLGQNKGAVGAAWQQWLGRNLSGVDGMFARGHSRMTMVIIVAWSDLASVIWHILGYSYKPAGTTDGSLKRVCPFQHPQFSFLYAEQISKIEPFGFNSVNGVVTPTNQIQYGADNGQDLGPWPLFDYAKITITFSTPNYNIIEDYLIITGDASEGEQSRYVERRCSGSVDILKRENGSFVWDNSSGKCPSAGVSLPMAVGNPVAKKKWSWIWKDVPDVGLFSSGGSDGGGQTQNIDGCYGTVNASEFMGFPAWTLLFDGLDLTPSSQVVNAAYLGLPLTSYPRSWDVRINFTYFDPNPEYTVASYPYHGHNLFPNPNDSLWYVIYSGDINQTTTGVSTGLAVVTGLSTNNLTMGASITGVGIPGGTTVLSIDRPTQIHMSNPFGGTTGKITTLTFGSLNKTLYKPTDFTKIFMMNDD